MLGSNPEGFNLRPDYASKKNHFRGGLLEVKNGLEIVVDSALERTEAKRIALA
jgi:hypothetical protein